MRRQRWRALRRLRQQISVLVRRRRGLRRRRALRLRATLLERQYARLDVAAELGRRRCCSGAARRVYAELLHRVRDVLIRHDRPSRCAVRVRWRRARVPGRTRGEARRQKGLRPLLGARARRCAGIEGVWAAVPCDDEHPVICRKDQHTRGLRVQWRKTAIWQQKRFARSKGAHKNRKLGTDPKKKKIRQIRASMCGREAGLRCRAGDKRRCLGTPEQRAAAQPERDN